MKHLSFLVVLLLNFSIANTVARAESAKTDWRKNASTTLDVRDKDVIVLGWRDLAGQASTIGFSYPDKANRIIPGGHGATLFVRWSGGANKLVYVEALVNANSMLKSIWRTELSGPGFQAINDISLGPEKTNNLLDIVIYKTAMPEPGSSPSPPGPPRKSHYVFDGTVYRSKTNK